MKEDSLTTPNLFQKVLGNDKWSGKMVVTAIYAGFIAFMIGMIWISKTVPKGDELYYMSMVQHLKNNGIYNEMAKGNPIGYILPVYLFSLLGIKPFLAGKIISVVFTVVTFFCLRSISKKIFSLSGHYLNLALITCLLSITSVRDYWSATSDYFYLPFIIWILVYLWEAAATWRPLKYFLWAGALMSLTVLIRPLSIMFFVTSLLAVIIIAFFDEVSFLNKALRIFIFITSFTFVFLAQQYPSLKENKTLAFEKKMPDQYDSSFHYIIKSDWAQRLILTNLELEKGQKSEHKGSVYVPWQECDDYLIKNGMNSLPSSPLQIPFWNFSYFIKYLTKGIIFTLWDFLRKSGFLFLLPLIFLFRPSFKKYRKFAFFTITILVYLGMYVVIVLNYGEPRDFMIPLLFSGILGVSLLQQMEKQNARLVNVLALLQLAIVVVDLILNIRYNFLS